MSITFKQNMGTPVEEKTMKFIVTKIISTAALLVALTLGSVAQADDPVPFTFNDRCVPYEIDPDVMRSFGVDPDKILTTFGAPEDAPPDDGTGNSGTPAPWTWDLDEYGEPVPCDEFHTHKRRTRYEGCHFYDGTPCYFTTNGQMDQDAFTNDAAGRRAFERAEHFVFYEVVQQLEQSPPSPFWPGGYMPAPIFTDPFAGGFAVGTQTKIMNTLAEFGGDSAAASYWQDSPLGIWRMGLIQFTPKAAACKTDFVTPDCVYQNDLLAANGTSSQNIGYPLIYSGDDIFGLTQRGLVSIRYRLGADGIPGGPEGPRYILCPVHQFPGNGDISPGNDIIQAFPTHIEHQPPSNMLVLPFGPRGHFRQVLFNAFGETPPPGAPGPHQEQKVYDNFDCLQRTGNTCL